MGRPGSQPPGSAWQTPQVTHFPVMLAPPLGDGSVSVPPWVALSPASAGSVMGVTRQTSSGIVYVEPPPGYPAVVEAPEPPKPEPTPDAKVPGPVDASTSTGTRTPPVLMPAAFGTSPPGGMVGSAPESNVVRCVSAPALYRAGPTVGVRTQGAEPLLPARTPPVPLGSFVPQPSGHATPPPAAVPAGMLAAAMAQGVQGLSYLPTSTPPAPPPAAYPAWSPQEQVQRPLTVLPLQSAQAMTPPVLPGSGVLPVATPPMPESYVSPPMAPGSSVTPPVPMSMPASSMTPPIPASSMTPPMPTLPPGTQLSSAWPTMIAAAPGMGSVVVPAGAAMVPEAGIAGQTPRGGRLLSAVRLEPSPGVARLITTVTGPPDSPRTMQGGGGKTYAFDWRAASEATLGGTRRTGSDTPPNYQPPPAVSGSPRSKKKMALADLDPTRSFLVPSSYEPVAGRRSRRTSPVRGGSVMSCR